MSKNEPPLILALEGHWHKTFAELPHDLQHLVGPTKKRMFNGLTLKYDANGNLLRDASGNFPAYEQCYLDSHVGGFLLEWDSLQPEQRRICAAQLDIQSQPESEAGKYYWELGCKKTDIETKIRELELSNHRRIPSEILLRDKNLKLLSAELAALRKRISEPFTPEEATECEEKSPRTKSVFDQKGSLILAWLINNKYDPLTLPAPKKGMSGVKKKCRDALLKPSIFTPSSFKSTWDRLRHQGKLKDATSSS